MKPVWPKYGNLAEFAGVYDWDDVQLTQTSLISGELKLCYGFYPCKLHVTGSGDGKFSRAKGGSISCLGSSGCSELALFSVSFSCMQGIFDTPAIFVKDSTLTIFNSSFGGCNSNGNGGFISFYSSSVSIGISLFMNLGSYGLGGAFTISGSDMIFHIQSL